MISVELPETADLRAAPELAALALLHAALVVADQALRREHGDLDGLLGFERPAELVAAYALGHAIHELRALLVVYAKAARRPTAHPDELPF